MPTNEPFSIQSISNSEHFGGNYDAQTNLHYNVRRHPADDLSRRAGNCCFTRICCLRTSWANCDTHCNDNSYPHNYSYSNDNPYAHNNLDNNTHNNAYRYSLPNAFPNYYANANVIVF